MLSSMASAALGIVKAILVLCVIAVVLIMPFSKNDDDLAKRSLGTAGKAVTVGAIGLVMTKMLVIDAPKKAIELNEASQAGKLGNDEEACVKPKARGKATLPQSGDC